MRWEMVQAIGPMGISAPLLLDRKWSRITHPASGGAELDGRTRPGTRVQAGVWELNPGFTQGVFNLNTVYTPGTSGAVGLTRYRFNVARTLTDIYFYIENFVFAGAPWPTLKIEVRSGTLSGPDTTAPGLLASTTLAMDGTLGWWRATGFNLSIAAGTVFWVCIGVSNFNGGGAIPQLMVTILYVANTHYELFRDAQGATSADGGQTLTAGSGPATQVLKFSDASVLGFAYPESTEPGQPLQVAADAHERGNVIAFPDSIKVFGGLLTIAPPGGPYFDRITALNVYPGNSGPGGAPISGQIQGSLDLTAQTGVLFTEPITFAASAPYRVTWSFSDVIAEPSLMLMTSNVLTMPAPPADVKAARIYGGSWYQTDASGGAWSDTILQLYRMALVVENFVPVPLGPCEDLAGQGFRR